MRLIAHRGNTIGPDSDKENSIEHLSNALEKGFDVEIDLWVIGDQLWLGHDKPESRVTENWLDSAESRIWIHCKNLDAVAWNSYRNFNWFFHESESLALTSKGFLWLHPGVLVNTPKSVNLNFERVSRSEISHLEDCYAFCGDYVAEL